MCTESLRDHKHPVRTSRQHPASLEEMLLGGSQGPHLQHDGRMQRLARVRADVGVRALQVRGEGARLLGQGRRQVVQRPGARGDAQLQEEQHAQQVVAGPPLEELAHEDVARACAHTRAVSDLYEALSRR